MEKSLREAIGNTEKSSPPLFLSLCTLDETNVKHFSMSDQFYLPIMAIFFKFFFLIH